MHDYTAYMIELTSEERTALEDLVTSFGAQDTAELLGCTTAAYVTSAIALPNMRVPGVFRSALAPYLGGGGETFYLLDGSGNVLTDGTDRLING